MKIWILFAYLHSRGPVSVLLLVIAVTLSNYETELTDKNQEEEHLPNLEQDSFTLCNQSI